MLGIQASLTAGERGAVFSNGSGLTATYVGFGDAAARIAGDAGLTYIAASDQLVINHNAAALPAATTGLALQLGGIDTSTAGMLIDGFAGTPTVTGRRANTTNASPSGLVLNDVMLAMTASGYTSAGAYSTPVDAIQVAATETWSGTNQGSKVFIRTTTTASTTVVTRMTISGGGVSIAPATTISDATASTTVGTGCLILSGGAGITGQATVGGNVQCNSRFTNVSTLTTAAASGTVSMWRSGGTIGAAGDMVLQTDSAGNGSFIFRNGITTPATVFTVGTTSASFASGVPLTISDSTASTTAGTGSLIVAGGAGVTGQLTVAGGIVLSGNSCTLNGGGSFFSGARFSTTSALTTADLTGRCSMWRSGGTIGAAGDMVFQSDLVGNGAFIFRAGTTTPVSVFTVDGKSGFGGNVTKAGTPSDADMQAPFSGAIIIDTTASKIWVRIGSTWKSVTVA